MLYFPSKVAATVLGLVAAVKAIPTAEEPSPFSTDRGILVNHVVADYFPHAIGDLSHWDVSARYSGYNASTEAWLSSLDPTTVDTDEEKAKILIAAAYAKPFDEGDADMANDLDGIIGTIAGETSKEIAERAEKRDSHFIISHAHVVVWHACAAFFSCVSGTSCQFSIDVGKAPRSHCENQGGQNCYISWSTYKVQAGFFSRTWTNCNAEVNNEHDNSASCEGKGDNTGGDVCLSNRASGCS